MKCEYCGEEFIATSSRQKYCSSKCRWRKNNKTPTQASKADCQNTRKCFVCGKEFERPRPNQICCSKECSKRYSNKLSHNRKKRYKEITIDSDISLFKLANRDKQQCQICGLLVDWTDKKEIDGTVICGDMYPSIDHITPISLGGLHEWTNVQLAHRVCNYRKSNKYIG